MTPQDAQKAIIKAIPEADIEKIVERNPSLEHNAREELGAISRSITEFVAKYSVAPVSRSRSQ